MAGKPRGNDHSRPERGTTMSDTYTAPDGTEYKVFWADADDSTDTAGTWPLDADAGRRPSPAGSTDAEAYSRLRWAVMETLSAAAIHEAETPGPLRRRLAELEDVFSSLPARERP